MAVVGARLDDPGGSSSGSAYIFTRSGGVWTVQEKLIASDAAPDDLFGSSVSTDGDSTICGAPENDDPETDSGAAYVFTLSVDTAMIVDYLLGITTDPTGLDLNDDQRVDAADVVTSIESP